MKLTLFSQAEISSIILPEKCVGHYWVRGKDGSGKVSDIVAVEATHNLSTEEAPQWQLKSNRRFHILDRAGQGLSSSPVLPLHLYRIAGSDNGMRYILYTEPLSIDRSRYSVYRLDTRQVRLSIGREQQNNDIVFENEFVSGQHAEIEISGNNVVIRDLGSTNNTYVNGRAVRKATLNPGDVVFIMGLQIVVVGQYIFLNNPDNKVTILSSSLKEFHLPSLPTTSDYASDDDPIISDEYYYQAPRFMSGVEVYNLKLDPPPSNQNKDELPTIMMVGPSVTMGMASVTTGLYSVVNAISRGSIGSAIPSMVMSMSMLLGTLMWPMVTRNYQKKLQVRKEELRQTTYREYLSQMEQKLHDEILSQESILQKSDVPAVTRASYVLSANPQIWERTRKHTDFLSLRLGYGDIPLKANIQCSERQFMMEPDNLVEAMHQLAEQKRWLSGVPICLPLAERYAAGVFSQREQLYKFAQSMILQITALHDYNEVKLVLICNEEDADIFSFARWLPHTMNNERTFRYIATNSEEAKRLSSVLDSIIEHRKSLGNGHMEDEKPYFVILCTDKKLAEKTECVRRVLECKENLNFSVLSIYEHLQDLPKQCSAVVELNGPSGLLTFIDDVSSEPLEFHTDSFNDVNMLKITRVLANTAIDISGSDFTLPSKYTFLEMLDIGMVEHLNLLDRWSSNDPTKSLAATIGIDKYGEPFRLDLHERAHGPHGLIAGMTGSGKSEFIISFILSLAVNFHPSEVAFILIDYKGGGMAKAFEHIPHTAGVITNLDGNGIKRSLASMRSELHRRERIFQNVSKQHNVSNIDIYKYQKLYREGKVHEPLPHLMIISDEFAELKKEQPDFMSELTSTARVGRSLGVHLILATQKPGGVVDEQIRSNSRFRVCLKVQDAGDSSEMLGRPEAASLVETGRFYLQVGNNELFELGQSAWAGAPYYASAQVVKNRDDAVSVIDTNGQIISEVNIDRFAGIKNPPKQLDVLTEYIRKVCAEENIVQWKMWLDPIPARILVDQLEEKYGAINAASNPYYLEPIVGEYDDPAHQSQALLRVPISRDGNVIVYGSTGSGKEMFLEAICYSLIKQHTPSQVNLYILDFGAEVMGAFSEAPHVGEVILSYESEKVNNLFKMMLGKLETRKKLFSQYGGDIQQYNVQSATPEANLVVIINNFAAFMELYEEKSDVLNYLSREGTKYGIYFILTCAGVNNVRFGLRQNFSTTYCLQLNNPDDYSSVVGKTDGLFPEKHRGRGMVRIDKDSLFEFQTACLVEMDPPYAFIRSFASKAAKEYQGIHAARVPVLPERVTEQFLAKEVQLGNLGHFPIGVASDSLEIAYYDFTESPVNLILSVNHEWQTFTDALCQLIVERAGISTMILAPMGKSTVRAREDLRVYTDLNSCVNAIREIFLLVRDRNNEYKGALEAGTDVPDYAPVFVMIQSLSLLKTMLESYKPKTEEELEASDDTPMNRLQLAMEKCAKNYHVYFLVAESSNTLNPFTVEGWYKNHINGRSGLWVGDGIDTQFRLTVNKKTATNIDKMDTEFGYVISNATATLVKLLQ